MNKIPHTMYHLFKNDLWGNRIPYVTVSDEDTATRLMEDKDLAITKVLQVPPSKSTIIMM